MDELTVNITENLEAVEVNITEGSITTIYPTPSTYKIDFTTDTTDIWAIYSKFNGNITSVTLDNVSSYTIDGVAVSLPFEVEFDQTYLIEVVKTNPSLAASITFDTSYIQFDEVQTLPDFSIGNGHYTYALDSVNGKLYKIDNTLFTLTNTSGVGTWTEDPLKSTINLPTITNGVWSGFIELKDGRMLIAGYNTGNTSKYVCFVNSDDTVTDFEGVVNSYFTFTGALSNYVLKWILYDYLEDVLYFFEGYTYYYSISLNLNTKVTDKFRIDMCPFPNGYLSKKIFFNPFKKVFILLTELDMKNVKLGMPITQGNYRYDRCECFNRNTNLYHTENGNTFYRLASVDSNTGQTLSYQNAPGASFYQYVFSYMIDADKNIVVAGSYDNKFAIWRLNDINNASFVLQYPETFSSIIDDGMFAFDDLHLLFKQGGKRIHCIDTSDPTGTAHPDFNYYDLPSECEVIYTNRLL